MRGGKRTELVSSDGRGNCGTLGVVERVVDDGSVIKCDFTRVFIEVRKGMLAPMFLERPSFLE